jgi:hypothetical protein
MQREMAVQREERMRRLMRVREEKMRRRREGEQEERCRVGFERLWWRRAVGYGAIS